MSSIRSVHSRQLLQHLLGEPDLVQRVRSLSPTQLTTIVHSVGLEDAGEVIALASTRQLLEVFDEDLWYVGRTGSDSGARLLEQEQFDAARFITWLEVLSEAGQAAVARRLTGLPFEVVTLAFSKLLLVLDMDALTEDVATSDETHDHLDKALDGRLAEEWEEFRVIARHEAGWDAVWGALVALDEADHALLRRVIERCADVSSRYVDQFDDLTEALNSEESLEEDARGTREERREARGFVAHADARAFIKAATRRIEYAGRDPISAAYFRRLPTSVPRGVGEGLGGRLGRALRAVETRVIAALPVEAQSDDRPLHSESSVDAAPTITSSQDSSWRAVLVRLREADMDAHAQRLEELSYLVNVLVVLSRSGQRHLRPVEAVELALAILDYGAPLDRGELAVDAAAATAMIDGQFRTAWGRWVYDGYPQLALDAEVVVVARAVARAAEGDH